MSEGFWQPPYRMPIPQGGAAGGGGQPQTQTQQVILPPWLESAAQGSVASAQALSQQPYQANPYAQVVPMTADQTQAYSTIAGLQGATNPAYEQAEQAVSGGGLLGQVTPETASQLTTNAQAIMNPYTAQVVNPSLQLMQQQLAQTTQGIDANAANVGAFGGSRQGVEEGVAQAQEAIGAGQLEGGLLQGEYNTALSSAQNMANQNLYAGEWATSELPQLETSQVGQEEQQAGLLENVGRAEQGQSQAEMDQQAQNWQTAWQYPYTQQEELEQALTSTPYGGTTITTGATPQRNIGASILGGAATGAILGSAIPGVGTGLGAAGGAILGFL